MANISSINGNPIVIGTSGIGDGAVTGAKIASGTVTKDNLAFSVSDEQAGTAIVGLTTALMRERSSFSAVKIGGYSPTSGEIATSSKYLRFASSTFGYPSDFSVVTDEGYSIQVFAFDKSTNEYIGCMSVNNTFVKSWSNLANLKSFNFMSYPDYYFKVAMRRDDNADIAETEIDNLHPYVSNVFSSGVSFEEIHGSNLYVTSDRKSVYLNTTGQEVGASIARRERTSDFIPVTAGEIISCATFVINSLDFWTRICLYNSDKEFIRVIDYNSPDNETYYNYNVKRTRITIRDGEAYIRVSIRYGFMQITRGNTYYDYDSSLIDKMQALEKFESKYLVKSINHRGYSRTAPENTAPAFSMSAQLGFWAVENDIRYTSDGVPVLLHDETINRTARNADGTELELDVYIRQITYNEALAYDFGISRGEKYAGTRIMSFEDFLDLCRRKCLRCYNEIKLGSREQTEALVRLSKRYGMFDNCTWISFADTYLMHVVKYEPRARVGLIVSEVGETSIASAISLKTGKNEVFIDTKTIPSSEVIDTLIDNDIKLEYYTPNLTQLITGMDPYVTGVTSDHVIAGDALYTGKSNIVEFDYDEH